MIQNAKEEYELVMTLVRTQNNTANLPRVTQALKSCYVHFIVLVTSSVKKSTPKRSGNKRKAAPLSPSVICETVAQKAENERF